MGLANSVAKMEVSSEDESIYITLASKKTNKLNEKKDIDPAEPVVFFQNEKVQEIDENTESSDHVTNSKMFLGWFSSFIQCFFRCSVFARMKCLSSPSKKQISKTKRRWSAKPSKKETFETFGRE